MGTAPGLAFSCRDTRGQLTIGGGASSTSVGDAGSARAFDSGATRRSDEVGPGLTRSRRAVRPGQMKAAVHLELEPSPLDAAIEALRACLDAMPSNDVSEADADVRSEIVTRIARTTGAPLRAIRDALRVLAPDPELDRMLRRSA